MGKPQSAFSSHRGTVFSPLPQPDVEFRVFGNPPCHEPPLGQRAGADPRGYIGLKRLLRLPSRRLKLSCLCKHPQRPRGDEKGSGWLQPPLQRPGFICLVIGGPQFPNLPFPPLSVPISLRDRHEARLTPVPVRAKSSSRAPQNACPQLQGSRKERNFTFFSRHCKTVP